jgi:hypothetical protein
MSSQRHLKMILVTAIALALLVPTAASAAVRQVAPGQGANGTCIAPASACDLRYAVETAAQSGDIINVGAGTYTLANTLNVKVPMTIQGARGPVPRIELPGKSFFTALNSTTAPLTMRHLEISADGHGATAVRVSNGSLHGLILRSGDDGISATITGTTEITGSAIISGGTAVSAVGGSSELRHVTAWGARNGMFVRGTGFGPLPTSSVRVHNSILHGDENDLFLQSDADTNASAQATIDHSSIRPDAIRKFGTDTVATDAGGNVSAAPLLADPANGDIHELDGSPTIDAGSHEFLDGLVDLEGEDRVQGVGTDIGADERVAAPPAPGTGPGTPGTGPGAPETGTGPQQPAAPALELGALRLRPSRFHVNGVRASRRGTRIRYSVSEAATTRFRVERKRIVRRGGRRVVRFVKLRGAFSHRDRAGANSLRFRGKLRGRVLKPGSYRLVAVASGADGRKSIARRAAFRILG